MSRLRLLLWKIHCGFRPKVAVVPVRPAGKVARAVPLGARKDGGGPAGRTCRCSETRPRGPGARRARVLPLQPGRGWGRLRGCVPRAKDPPRGLGVPSPHRGPTHLRGRKSRRSRGHRNWDRAPGAWPSRSAPARPPSCGQEAGTAEVLAAPSHVRAFAPLMPGPKADSAR